MEVSSQEALQLEIKAEKEGFEEGLVLVQVSETKLSAGMFL